jgi:regulator of protease activity HflC (stomatin/prohibitin superfamily)
MNVRTQVYEYESFVQTLDLQEVTLPIAINYSVIPDQASELYQEVGQSYVETIIAPAAFQASTEAAGKIEAAAIAQSRAELAQSIGTILAPQLAAHGIFVEFVSVKDAVFDTDFIAAIKAKVIAEQKAEESLRLVQVATNNAESVRRTASGDADALAFLGAGEGIAISEVSSALGFTTQEYLLWQRLQQWNGKLPDTVLGSGNDVIVDLP